MTIANVALTNTFDTWRTRSNQVFSRMNQFAVNNSALYANTLTANVSFTAKGSSTIGTNPTSVHRISGFTTINNKLTVTGNVVFSNATSSFQIPTGTTAQRTGAVTGLFRFNTTTSSFEGYGATGWGSIGGGGLSTFKLVSSTYTANTLDRVAVNTSSGAVTVNLPASPAYGDIVEFADLNRKFSNNNLTVGRNTKTIEGQSQDLLGDVNGAHFSCVYDGTTWQIITHNTTEVSLGGVLSGTSGTATFANPLAISSANVNLTGTGKTLIKTANTDVRGGSFLVTSNATFVGTQTKLRSANVDILGPGEFLVRKANTDIRGGTLLVTSNLSLMGTGGIKFKDGTSQTTAATGGGGGGFFLSTLTASVQANVSSSAMTTVHTAPSTTGKRYIIYSLRHVNANGAYADIQSTAAIVRGANAHAISAGIPIPGATALELLKKPKVMYPNDTLKMRTDVGTSKIIMSYATADDSTYFSNGLLHTNAVANTLYSFTDDSTVESVLLVNSNTTQSIQATVEWTTSGNVNKAYLAYGLVVPPQSSVELIENIGGTYFGTGEKIRVTAGATTPANALRSHIVGKTI